MADLSGAPPTTLHILGLPLGATRQDVYLLLCTLTGFEHANLMYDKTGKTRPPVVFAKFDTTQNAAYAKDILSSLPFQAGSSRLMSVDFASQQSRGTKTDKTVDSNEDYALGGAASGVLQQPMSQRFSPYGGGAPAAPTLSFGGKGVTAGAGGYGRGGGGSSSTLFVQSSNGVPLTEAGLHTLTTNYPGVLKVTTRGTNAWIKFKTAEDASGALNLDGYEGDVIGGAQIKVQLARTDSYTN